MPARQYSQLYRQLRDLDPTDYQRVIRTFEEREREIGQLDLREHFELTVYYVDALHATGAYRQHQLMIDPVIEACVVHDIRRVEGLEQDVYQFLLFRKATAAYRLQDYPTAIRVAEALVGINPRKTLHRQLLRAAGFQEQRRLLQFGRAAFILCMLVTALVITTDLLFVRAFYPARVPLMQTVTANVFLAGLLFLAGAYGLAFYRARRAARNYQRAAANKSARNPDTT